MEKSAYSQPILAAAPADLAHIRVPDALMAHLAYRLEDGPKLYRSAAPEEIQGGILAVDDTPLRQIGSSQFLCRQAVRECRARGAIGLFANWSRKPSQEMAQLTAQLEQALLDAGLALWVPEMYANCVRQAKILISSALSGGTLRRRLEEAVQRYQLQRVTLAVERMAEDFLLPSQNGCGTPLSPQQLEERIRTLHPSVYYSAELCAHYFTYAQGSQIHFVLFDTYGSLRKKWQLASQLGLPYTLFAWEEVRGGVQELFGLRQP